VKIVFVLVCLAALTYSQSTNCKVVEWKRMDSCTIEIRQKCDRWITPAGPVEKTGVIITLKSETPILQVGDPEEIVVEPEVSIPRKYKWNEKKAKPLKTK
jgi:hypothetical protein